VDDEYVYSVDAVRGIDILKLNRAAPVASGAALARSWQPTGFEVSAATVREQYVCRRSVRRRPAG
jgi:hypothetical protein